jgi:acetyl-CoA acetyltransferase
MKFGVSRADQDAFAVRSHHFAAKAHADGFYSNEIIPVNGKIQVVCLFVCLFVVESAYLFVCHCDHSFSS